MARKVRFSVSFLLFSLFFLAIKSQEIPKRDYGRFNYYSIKLDAPSLRLSKRVVSLEKRAYEAAKDAGYFFLGRIGHLSDYFLVAVEKSRDSGQVVPWTLEQERQIPQKRLFKRSLSPLDCPIENEAHQVLKRRSPAAQEDFASLGIRDPGFPRQWHLYNTIIKGHDINVYEVWKEGITGANVTVSFLDDGIDYEHPDLKDNFYLEGSYDFNDHQQLPTPTLSDDKHGTRCAGEVAAKRNNACGVGIAWDAKVSGIRILSGTLTQADEAAAITFDYQNNKIYSCSWGPADDGAAVDAPPKIVAEAFVEGIKNGRGGLGSLYVFASGNGGRFRDNWYYFSFSYNSNYDGYTNSIFTMTIGAIDMNHRHPIYAEECAAQFAVTYSSDDMYSIVFLICHRLHKFTSDWPQTCTASHGGTSAAAPLASGIYALVMSVRQDLTWRDFQHLTVQTAVPINLVDSTWEQVAKGRVFSHHFGFGKLDATKIVRAAKSYTKVGPQTQHSSPLIPVDIEIPQGEEGILSSYNFTEEQWKTANFKGLEHVTVAVTIEHKRRGDIEVDLISPHGWVSQLATQRPSDSSEAGLTNWIFLTVKHWDEYPVGQWTIRVRDRANPMYTGRFKSWSITLWAESGNGTKPSPPAIQVQDSSSSATIAFVLVGVLVMAAIGGVAFFIGNRQRVTGDFQEFQALNETELGSAFDEFAADAELQEVELHAPGSRLARPIAK